MKPNYFIIPTFLLFCNQCQPLSINPIIASELLKEKQIEESVAAAKFAPLLPFNSSQTDESNHLERNQRRECSIHSHCSRHHYCGCSWYCQNNYGECKRRKRAADPNWSEEKDDEEFTRSQRDCESRRHDLIEGHVCYTHADCGCNRRCSCHGYCTYIC